MTRHFSSEISRFLKISFNLERLLPPSNVNIANQCAMSTIVSQVRVLSSTSAQENMKMGNLNTKNRKKREKIGDFASSLHSMERLSHDLEK